MQENARTKLGKPTKLCILNDPKYEYGPGTKWLPDYKETWPCADGVVVIAISLFPEPPSSIHVKGKKGPFRSNMLVRSCGSFVKLS